MEPGNSPKTFGERLRREREARDVTLEQVAAATKIGRRHLSALERNEFDDLPGDVFVKGYVRAIAGFIGADAGSLVADYMRQKDTQTQAGARTEDAVVREMSRVLKVGADSKAARGERFRAAARAAAATAAVMLALAALAWGAFGFLRPAKVTAPPAVRAEVRETSRPAASASPPPAHPEPAKNTPSPEALPRPAGPPKNASAPSSQRAESRAPAKQSGSPPPPPSEPARTTAPPPASPPPARSSTPVQTSPASQPPPPPSSEVQAARPAALAASPSESIVSEFGVGTDVVNLQLVGERDTFREGDEVWFWTRVLRGSAEGRIRHVWIHEGHEVSSIELEVGSDNWRTQSRRTLSADSLGGWAVEARDMRGRVLARAAFVCISH